MQLDPTRWLVSLAGFIYDWIITREWSRVLWCWLPLLLVTGMAVAAASGSWRDRNQLAQWYLELGNEEIAEWEQAWAPTAVAEPATSPGDGADAKPADAQTADAEADTSVTKQVADAKAEPTQEDGKQVSRFAETLFRRVQMLVPSERSQFVIAATLAQRGAVDQARAMLSKVAPDNARGYAPAHALLAQFLLMELKDKVQTEGAQITEQLRHHTREARRWDRCPQSVLQAGSDLHMLAGDMQESLAQLASSAERNPEDNYHLAGRARKAGDQRLFDQAWPRAEQYLLASLAADPKSDNTRLQLSELYYMANNLERSEEVLLQVPEADRSPEIVRALSQVYLLRYGQSQSQVNDKVTVNMSYLDLAMRIDPTNPYVAEEIAKLARMQGPRPSDEMIEHLKSRLAEGTATGATHACLAEMRLLRKELDKAIPHLEQVVNRLPNAAEYLNNLAYCLAELHPERYQEALQYATRAVEESRRQPNADYYDTLAYVLSRLDRHKEAITAVETAIELDRRRTDFHERAAAEYKTLGDESMAQVHLKRIEVLKIEEAERIEAERLAAEKHAAEEKLAAERLEAERKKAEELEAIRYASEQAMAAIAEEVAQEAALNASQ